MTNKCLIILCYNVKLIKPCIIEKLWVEIKCCLSQAKGKCSLVVKARKDGANVGARKYHNAH